MHKAVRCLIYSQISFFGLIGLCIMLQPAGLTANNGISYYGILQLTYPLYLLAYFSITVFMLRSTFYLPKKSKDLRIVSYCLRSLALFLVGILLTPYTYSAVFDLGHKVFGTVLFCVQLCLAVWLGIRTKWDNLTTVLITIQLIGGLIALFSLFDSIFWEIQGQIIFQLAFGILLIRGVNRLLEKEKLNGRIA